MHVCRSCGSSFSGNFCSNCGAPAVPNNSLLCPRCNSVSAPNMAFCSNCGTALQSPQYGVQGPQYPPAPQPPYYPNQPVPQQQNNVGKYLMGALGGAAAVIGGEILMHDVEKGIERHVERDVERREWIGEPHHHRHHHDHHHHHRRCACGHEFSIDIDVCPRCRRRWDRW